MQHRLALYILFNVLPLAVITSVGKLGSVMRFLINAGNQRGYRDMGFCEEARCSWRLSGAVLICWSGGRLAHTPLCAAI